MDWVFTAALVALALFAVPVVMMGYDWIIRDGLSSAPKCIHLYIRKRTHVVRRWLAVWILNLSFGLVASFTLWLASHATHEPLGVVGSALILVGVAATLGALEDNLAYGRRLDQWRQRSANRR